MGPRALLQAPNDVSTSVSKKAGGHAPQQEVTLVLGWKFCEAAVDVEASWKVSSFVELTSDAFPLFAFAALLFRGEALCSAGFRLALTRLIVW